MLSRRLSLSCVFLCVLGASGVFPQERRPIKLPAPRTDGGRPLMQVLKDRKSGRAFASRELPLQALSDLLWAANGVNRPATGHRTAPSAHNWQEVEVYAAMADGVWRYAARDHSLQPVLGEDVRGLTGTQDFVKEAPLNLVYVADDSKMSGEPESDRALYAAVDSGVIAQNVYLFCASEGLAVVVRAGIDRTALAKKLGLGPQQRITLAQSVGYPK